MAAFLAFDTSGEPVRVGVSVHGRSWLAEEAGGAQASANLLPCVQRLLRAADVGLGDLDAIAFGRGPGAFTGLRAACAAAQGLAWGAGLPTLPIDTLMAVAEDARTRVGAIDVWVAMDARMGEVYAGRYGWSGNRWRTLEKPALCAPDALAARVAAQPAAWLAGSAARAMSERLTPASTSIDPQAQPTARALLACAEAAWSNGEAIGAAAAAPLYLRDRVALTTAEREAAARGVA